MASESAGVPGEVSHEMSLDRSDAPHTETQVDAHTSVYGPRVTEARGREVALLMRWFGRTLEQLAWAQALAWDCVVIGRDERVEALLVGIRIDAIGRYADPYGKGSICMGVVSRARLVERLDAIGRHDDAAKVLGGPPDAPTPGPHPRARLLVACADDACLAVTWSQGWRDARALEEF